MDAIPRMPKLEATEIFNDPSLNDRFYTAIQLLAQIMMVMPRTASIATLAQVSGKSPRLIRSILATLSKDGLVAKDGKEKDAWHCRNCNGVITLADVYRCFSKAEQKKTSESEASNSKRSASQQNIDVLMMQVKMTLNHALLQQLEQFDLSRLRGLASASAFRMPLMRARQYTENPH